jgi:hypothetical protein
MKKRNVFVRIRVKLVIVKFQKEGVKNVDENYKEN